MFRMMMIAAAAATTLGTAAQASTADIYLDAGNSAHVRYSDLDLQSKAGRVKLASRIRGAADLLCTAGTDLVPSNGARDECFRTVVATGRDKMNAVVASASMRAGQAAAR